MPTGTGRSRDCRARPKDDPPARHSGHWCLSQQSRMTGRRISARRSWMSFQGWRQRQDHHPVCHRLSLGYCQQAGVRHGVDRLGGTGPAGLAAARLRWRDACWRRACRAFGDRCPTAGRRGLKAMATGSAGQPGPCGEAKHVVLIGAGIVGAAIAVELVRRGQRVTIIEPETPGGEHAASYGNGGWLSPRATNSG